MFMAYTFLFNRISSRIIIILVSLPLTFRFIRFSLLNTDFKYGIYTNIHTMNARTHLSRDEKINIHSRETFMKQLLVPSITSALWIFFLEVQFKVNLQDTNNFTVLWLRCKSWEWSLTVISIAESSSHSLRRCAHTHTHTIRTYTCT